MSPSFEHFIGTFPIFKCCLFQVWTCQSEQNPLVENTAAAPGWKCRSDELLVENVGFCQNGFSLGSSLQVFFLGALKETVWFDNKACIFFYNNKWELNKQWTFSPLSILIKSRDPIGWLLINKVISAPVTKILKSPNPKHHNFNLYNIKTVQTVPISVKTRFHFPSPLVGPQVYLLRVGLIDKRISPIHQHLGPFS